MFRMVPFQADCLQAGLPDSETPGGTGYLGKEKRVGEVQVRGGGRERKTKTEHKYEGAGIRPCPPTPQAAAEPERTAHPMVFPSSGVSTAQTLFKRRKEIAGSLVTAEDSAHSARILQRHLPAGQSKSQARKQLSLFPTEAASLTAGSKRQARTSRLRMLGSGRTGKQAQTEHMGR